MNALPTDRPEWLVGFTNVTSPTNERTFLPTLPPESGVAYRCPLMLDSKIMRDAVAALLRESIIFHVSIMWYVRKVGGSQLNSSLSNNYQLNSWQTISSCL